VVRNAPGECGKWDVECPIFHIHQAGMTADAANRLGRRVVVVPTGWGREHLGKLGMRLGGGVFEVREAG
jgi:hypothetical protein